MTAESDGKPRWPRAGETEPSERPVPDVLGEVPEHEVCASIPAERIRRRAPLKPGGASAGRERRSESASSGRPRARDSVLNRRRYDLSRKHRISETEMAATSLGEARAAFHRGDRSRALKRDPRPRARPRESRDFETPLAPPRSALFSRSEESRRERAECRVERAADAVIQAKRTSAPAGSFAIASAGRGRWRGLPSLPLSTTSLVFGGEQQPSFGYSFENIDRRADCRSP